MKEVLIPRFGPPEVLILNEKVDPVPAAKEVRVRVQASGINFADIMARMGLYPDAPPPPMVVGYEISGIVDAVGSEVSTLQIGDEVIGVCRFGGYADTICLPLSQVFLKPKQLSFEQAATIPVNYLTAYQMLVVMAGTKSGDRILVHSAGGGVGLAVVDLGKILGAEIIGIASQSKHEALRERGVEKLIDSKTTDLNREVRKLTDNQGVHTVLDPVGGDSWKKGIECLAPTGKLVVFGFSGAVQSKNAGKLNALLTLFKVPWLKFNPLYLMNKNIGVLGVNLGHLWKQQALVNQWSQQLLHWANEDKLRPTVAKTFPFDEAPLAHHYIQNRKNFGKVLLVPNV